MQSFQRIMVLKGFETTKTVELKSASCDLVTEFDRNTELLLIQTLSQAFPDHKFIGEETTGRIKLTEQPTWIIDPIDGTTNFVHGYPHCAISVGLSVDKVIIIGAVCNPIMKQQFTAIKGRGSFLNGVKLSTSKVEELKEALVGLEISIGAFPGLAELFTKRYRSCIPRVQGIRSLGSAQLSLCMVASGVWDAYHVEYLYPWDMAAGSLIITEAGGSVLDVDGSNFDVEYGRCIAAGTESLARKLVEVFRVD
ncbi:uncharacterized protein isoform X2 [Rhodnius prolixus]|uniref:uncharacterized protein isoform X2 n=1 Tax=Rhodnius prolixus TaxID=13249 RepID=UPI003D18CF80